MKKLLVYAAFAVVIAGCGTSTNKDNQAGTDTLSPASGATGMGPDTNNQAGGDTTGLNVGAAQPVDSTRK